MVKKTQKNAKRTANKNEKVYSSSDKCCGIPRFLNEASKEMKLAYFLIVVLFIMVITLQLFYTPKNMNTSINKWIDQNPEAILDSVNKYVSQKQKEEIEKRQQSAQKGLKESKDEIFSTKYSAVLNPKGTTTVVEFFDYNCGYCRQVSKVVEQVAKEDKNTRFILKQLPILGPTSKKASEVVIAVTMTNPSKFKAVHNALMENGARTEQDIENAVKKAGLRYSTIEKVLSSKAKEIEKALMDNVQLAQSLGINGTPAFIIEDQFVPGALDYNTLKDLIAKAKK